MSTYFEPGRGWKYDFQFKKRRHQSNYYKTKTEARETEAERRKELKNPVPIPETPTDMAFLTLVNKRMDYLQAYRSNSHYMETKYLAKRWVKEWKKRLCSEISSDDIRILTSSAGRYQTTQRIKRSVTCEACSISVSRKIG